MPIQRNNKRKTKNRYNIFKGGGEITSTRRQQIISTRKKNNSNKSSRNGKPSISYNERILDRSLNSGSIYFEKEKIRQGISKIIDSREIIPPVIDSIRQENALLGYIMSHGCIITDQIKIPHNIILLTYTTPFFILGIVDAYHIARNISYSHKIIQPPHRRNITTGEIFQPDGKFTIYKPGEFTQNLKFTHDSDMMVIDDLFEMGVVNPDGTKILEYVRNRSEVDMTLGRTLQILSDKYDEDYPNEIITLVQLSCRGLGNADQLVNEYEQKGFDEHRYNKRRTSDIPSTIPIETLKKLYNNRYMKYVDENYVEVYLINGKWQQYINKTKELITNDISLKNLKILIDDLFKGEGRIKCSQISLGKNNHNVTCKLEYDGEELNNECFTMKISEKEMFISKLKFPNEIGCKLKGPYILNKMYQIASFLQLKSIFLDDYSKIYFKDKGPLFIDLAAFKILTDGESWYNKHCFYSKNYKNEIILNKNLRKEEASDKRFGLPLMTHKNKSIGNLMLETKEQLKIDDSETFFKEVGNYVNHMKQFISYTNFELELKVDNDKTKQFYANLNSQFMDVVL
jgi:hypothetical protein